jgi:hypothetical protein
MVRISRKGSAISLIALSSLGTPALASAQRGACDKGDRATVRPSYDRYGREIQRPAAGQASRAAAPRTAVQYAEREPERTATKTALMIGGSAAAGAGVGGALHGSKGALIGAAIGGGAASIYEATRRR